jgi:hypothetical protein
MKNFRVKLLRVHGTLAIVMGIALTVNCSLETFAGIGSFKFLQQNPMGMVGLMQAYLLLAMIGFVLWTGSYLENTQKFHIIGALAYCPPLAANIIFFGMFTEMGMAWASLAGSTFHIIFISLESFAAFYKLSS